MLRGRRGRPTGSRLAAGRGEVAASAEQQEHAVARAGKIFALVRQAAERGEPCPTNAALGERFGCGRARIVAAFDFLASNGMITVERGSDWRVVTITASGKATHRPHYARAA